MTKTHAIGAREQGLDASQPGIVFTACVADESSVIWESFGVRLQLHRCSGIEAEEMLTAMPPGQVGFLTEGVDATYFITREDGSEDDAAEVYVLRREADNIYRTASRDLVLYALQNDACWYVATNAPRYSFVHSGAVAYRGHGIILPGVSGAGKSTLVSRLLERGAQYYSDEYAVLDLKGCLHPFPCLLKFKDGGVGGRRLPPQSFGASAGTSLADVSCVVFPTYDSTAPLRAEMIEQGEAALHLLEHMPAARLRPQQILSSAAAVSQRAECLRLRYNDSSQAADYLIQLLDRRVNGTLTTGDIHDEH